MDQRPKQNMVNKSIQTEENCNLPDGKLINLKKLLADCDWDPFEGIKTEEDGNLLDEGFKGFLADYDNWEDLFEGIYEKVQPEIQFWEGAYSIISKVTQGGSVSANLGNTELSFRISHEPAASGSHEAERPKDLSKCSLVEAKSWIEEKILGLKTAVEKEQKKRAYVHIQRTKIADAVSRLARKKASLQDDDQSNHNFNLTLSVLDADKRQPIHSYNFTLPVLQGMTDKHIHDLKAKGDIKYDEKIEKLLKEICLESSNKKSATELQNIQLGKEIILEETNGLKNISKSPSGGDNEDNQPQKTEVLNDAQVCEEPLMNPKGAEMQDYKEPMKNQKGADMQYYEEPLMNPKGSEMQDYKEPLMNQKGADMQYYEEPLKNQKGADMQKHEEPLMNQKGADMQKYEEPLMNQKGADMQNYEEPLMNPKGADMQYYEEPLMNPEGAEMNENPDEFEESQVLLRSKFKPNEEDNISESSSFDSLANYQPDFIPDF